ncbi:elongation factor 4 [candidate division WOR-3 bacterium]|nr:elongation factor 4 [candidate division WOR-3 bacterium]
MAKNDIRNFCIIAHIDHGKSTLADRLLEHTQTVHKRIKLEQYLDNMDLEKERGITIKSHNVRMNYKSSEGHQYQLNLIDTPGHVDFSYEVSRSISACEGALLVVDATQGVQAQTVSNAYLAIDQGLEIIPVINKIDLPSADPEKTKFEIEEYLGLDTENSVMVSAKTGHGIEELLESIVEYVPPPVKTRDADLRALVYDSYYDEFWGAVLFVKVVSGELKTGDRIKLVSADREFDVQHLGFFSPEINETKKISTGEVGFVSAGIRSLKDVNIGDTLTLSGMLVKPLPGFRKSKPMVYAGLYPSTNDKYRDLKESLERLSINDSAIVFSPEKSNALGFGFRAGFLGLLHMDIVQERLEREFGVELVVTAPTVPYRVTLRNGEIREVNSPSELPGPSETESIEEPMSQVSIHTPSEFLGNVIKICHEKRGTQKKIEYIAENHVRVDYEMPLSSVIVDFHDLLKSSTKGYASLDYEWTGFSQAKMTKLDFLINNEPIDALSIIVQSDEAYNLARRICLKLRKTIKRQLYEVAIQGVVNGKIIARETIKPLRKDVTAKCYGGDITRKRKLLEKQKEGKKRMKMLGKIEIPQEAFMSVLSIESDN